MSIKTGIFLKFASFSSICTGKTNEKIGLVSYTHSFFSAGEAEGDEVMWKRGGFWGFEEEHYVWEGILPLN